MPEREVAAVVLAVHAAAGKHLERACAELAAGVRADGVHAARRELRRARALLRLAHHSSARAEVRAADRTLRAACRALGRARDAAQLKAELRTLVRVSGVAQQAVAATRRALARERQVALTPAAAATIQVRVATLRVRLARRPGRGDAAGVARAFAGIYRRARAAGRAARRQPTTDTLHEWRKWARRYSHCLDFFCPAWPRVIGALARDAHLLVDLLGSDHNLALLGRRLEADPPSIAYRQRLARHLQQSRQQARRAAFALGERLFAARPAEERARAGVWCRLLSDGGRP